MNKPFKELDHICNLIGQFIEYWGFKSIEGKIWAHLLLSKRPLCPTDLMERTGVSKGLVSISITRLIEFDVIKFAHREGKRTQFYQVNENITEVIKGVLRTRERKMIADISTAIMLLEQVPLEELNDISQRRIKFLKNTTHYAGKILDILLFGGKPVDRLNFGLVPKLEKGK
jgi:DNA-binding transcriptional regulator GbsR (MarR family)